MAVESCFIRNSRIIGSALSICEQFYQGALGHYGKPEEARIAEDPLDVIADMADALRMAREKILGLPGETEE